MRRRGPGLIGIAARTAVIAGTATAVSGSVHNKQEKKAMEQQAQAQQAAAAAAPAPAPAPAPVAVESEMVTKLKELASLRDAGILTEEEFSAQKAKILG